MKTVRKTIEIDEQLATIIQEMADKQKWSFSTMGYVLLQKAVKERCRKKANAKEVHIPDNTTN